MAQRILFSNTCTIIIPFSCLFFHFQLIQLYQFSIIKGFAPCRHQQLGENLDPLQDLQLHSTVYLYFVCIRVVRCFQYPEISWDELRAKNVKDIDPMGKVKTPVLNREDGLSEDWFYKWSHYY